MMQQNNIFNCQCQQTGNIIQQRSCPSDSSQEVLCEFNYNHQKQIFQHQSSDTSENENTTAESPIYEENDYYYYHQPALQQCQSQNTYTIDSRKLLGTGKNAHVYQAYNLVEKTNCAVKQFNTEFFTKSNQSQQEITSNQQIFNLFQNEAYIMSYINNNINSNYFTKLQDAFLCKNSPHQNLYMEICPQGTLEQYYRKMNPLQALQIFQQITQGVYQLKQHNIIHRDLKLSNIFFKDSKIKIGDFGFAIQFPKGASRLQTRYLGTALYECPEILLKTQDFYTLEHDIFSLGVILHLLIYKKYPFIENPQQNLLERLQNKQRVQITTQRYKVVDDLLDKMLSINPNQRISWEQLMNDPLIILSPQNLLQISELQNLSGNNTLPLGIEEFLSKSIHPFIFKSGPEGPLTSLEFKNPQNKLFRTLNAEEVRRLKQNNNYKQKSFKSKTLSEKYQQLQKTRDFKMMKGVQEQNRQKLRNDYVFQTLGQMRKQSLQQL